jgi:hypothetical protein
MIATDEEFQRFWTRLKPLVSTTKPGASSNVEMADAKPSLDNIKQQIKSIISNLNVDFRVDELVGAFQHWHFTTSDLAMNDEILFRLLVDLIELDSANALKCAQATLFSTIVARARNQDAWQRFWIEIMALTKANGEFMAKALVPCFTWSINDKLILHDPLLSEGLIRLFKDVFSPADILLLLRFVTMQLSTLFPESIIPIVQTIFTHKKHMDNAWADVLAILLCHVNQDVIHSKKYPMILLQFTQWLVKLDNASFSALTNVKKMIPQLAPSFLKSSLEKALK